MTMNINTNTNTNTPAVSNVSPEDKVTGVVANRLDKLSPETVDKIAGRGASMAAVEIISTVDEFTVDQLEKLGAAAVRRAARKTVADFYKAHCARRSAGR
jgi:hypothetical protein